MHLRYPVLHVAFLQSSSSLPSVQSTSPSHFQLGEIQCPFLHWNKARITKEMVNVSIRWREKMIRAKTNHPPPPEVFLRKGGLKMYSTFTREHPCLSVISINLQSNLHLLHIFQNNFS